MTKDLYRLATQVQGSILQLTGDDPAKIASVPRVMLDAWATLQRWHLTGEAIVRITEEEEQALLDHVLPRQLPLAQHALRKEALACQLPDRSEWIVIARHAPAPVIITVHGDVHWAYRQPLLTYVTSDEAGGYAAGFINIQDQPTPANIALLPGFTLGIKGANKLTEAEISTEDFRITLAITKLYR